MSAKKPDASRLTILIDLRKQSGLSQAVAAALCGLTGSQGRKSLSDWELGKVMPDASRRTRFRGYLWDGLLLRKRPEEFERVWKTLVEEWKWEPISDAEWRELTNTPRPPRPDKLADPAKPIPLLKPPRIEHFTGRQDELDRLLTDLQPGKVVTLCGPAGIGKSALAAEAVWLLAPGDDLPERFPDGIVFHTFYHQPQADMALEVIARACNVDTRPSPRDAARLALANRKALLILDGAEAADDLPAVLSVAGSCGVLITTRRHKQAPAGGQDIEPLPRDESLALLRAWSGAYADDDAAANEIVELLGGLPLALFLVGRYLVSSKQQAADFMAGIEETGLAALHFDKRPSESVPLLLARSLDQVSEAARRAFGVAGVLALAPFDAEIVAAALEITSPAAHRILAELVDYGLLLRPDARYQVTHALAHRYAHTHAPPNGETVARLALHYAALAERESERGTSGFAVLDDHRAHIVAVQAAALAAEQWDAVRQIAWQVYSYLDLKGYWTASLAVNQAGLDAVRTGADRYYEAEFANRLGVAYYSLGQPRRAIEFYERKLAISREIGDRGGEGAALGNLGLAYADLGETRRAVEFYEQCLAIARETGNRRMEGNGVGSLGLAYADLGETRRAVEFYEQHLLIAREVGDRRAEGSALGNLGIAYYELGNTSRATELFNQALVVMSEVTMREIGDWGEEGTLFVHLSESRRTIGFSPQLHVISPVRGYSNWIGGSNACGNLGALFAALGETRRAVELYEQQLVIAHETGDRRGKAIAGWNLGAAYEELGDLARAVANLQVYVAYLEELGHPDAAKRAQRVAELKQRAGL